ncbi:hypothetical protein IID24_05335 [Patescibacteria group bacterium]|nr:hypothetical protein [Patescibacteria group bacterium]
MSTLKNQKDMVKFLLRTEEDWHTFGRDRDSIEIACALHNLGIAEVKGGEIILKSREKAKRWLDSFEE